MWAGGWAGGWLGGWSGGQPTVEPPAPRPRNRVRTGGSGGIGGGGGGGWIDDPPWDPYCDVIDPDDLDLPAEELGEVADVRSVPQRLAELLGTGFAGFTLGKTATKLAGETFGKTGATIAAVSSVAAASSATKSLKGRYRWPLVLGTTLAAIDDLVDIYVDERPVGKPLLVQDVVTFAKAAKAAGAPIAVSRLNGTSKSTGQDVVVLRYDFVAGTPAVTYRYQEILRRGADGKFNATRTLLKALRDAQR